jgi:hypothetical protein
MKAIVLRVWEFMSRQLAASQRTTRKEEETWLGI